MVDQHFFCILHYQLMGGSGERGNGLVLFDENWVKLVQSVVSILSARPQATLKGSSSFYILGMMYD